MRRLIAAIAAFAITGAAAEPMPEPEPAPVPPPYELEPYSAVYTVTRGRIRVGEMTTTLERRDDGTWEYRSESRTTGLLSLLRDIRIVERSVFRVVDGEVRSLEHDYDFDGGRKNRNFSLEFDWENCVVHGTRYGEPVSAELVAGATDRHATPVAVMYDVATARAFPRPFVMIDRARTRHYENSIVGTGRLELKAGPVETIEVLQQRVDDETRRFRTWLAPSMGFLPVRIQSIDDEGADVTLDLVKYTPSGLG